MQKGCAVTNWRMHGGRVEPVVGEETEMCGGEHTLLDTGKTKRANQKKTLNNNKQPITCTPEQIYEAYAWFGDVTGVKCLLKAALTACLTRSARNPWLIAGSRFGSNGANGNTCGQGSCDNPAWPRLRWCPSPWLEGEFPAGDPRSPPIPWHWATSTVNEIKWCVLPAPFNGEVVLVDKLPLFYRSGKFPALLLEQMLLPDMKPCSQQSWGFVHKYHGQRRHCPV